MSLFQIDKPAISIPTDKINCFLNLFNNLHNNYLHDITYAAQELFAISTFTTLKIDLCMYVSNYLTICGFPFEAKKVFGVSFS